jgi:hypothetical protein
MTSLTERQNSGVSMNQVSAHAKWGEEFVYPGPYETEIWNAPLHLLPVNYVERAE